MITISSSKHICLVILYTICHQIRRKLPFASNNTAVVQSISQSRFNYLFKKVQILSTITINTINPTLKFGKTCPPKQNWLKTVPSHLAWSLPLRESNGCPYAAVKRTRSYRRSPSSVRPTGMPAADGADAAAVLVAGLSIGITVCMGGLSVVLVFGSLVSLGSYSLAAERCGRPPPPPSSAWCHCRCLWAGHRDLWPPPGSVLEEWCWPGVDFSDWLKTSQNKEEGIHTQSTWANIWYGITKGLLSSALFPTYESVMKPDAIT